MIQKLVNARTVILDFFFNPFPSEHCVGQAGADTLSSVIILTFTAANCQSRLCCFIINLISILFIKWTLHTNQRQQSHFSFAWKLFHLADLSRGFWCPRGFLEKKRNTVKFVFSGRHTHSIRLQQCALHVRTHKVTPHCGASVWAPFKWDPLSLPQLNTVCQYLGHRGLIMEIWHTHRLANTRWTNTRCANKEKCWHPTAILSCKLLLDSQ